MATLVARRMRACCNRFQRRPAAFGRATAPGPAQFAVTRVPVTVPLMCTSSLLSSALYWSVVKSPW